MLPPPFLAGTGACCATVVTHAPAIPAISAPSHLMDHVCPWEVIFSAEDMHKTCCGQSAHQEVVASVLTPGKGLEWVAGGGSFPACTSIWFQYSQVRGPSCAGPRGKDRTPLSTHLLVAKVFLSRVWLHASSGPSWPRFLLSFPSRKIHISSINKLQTLVMSWEDYLVAVGLCFLWNHPLKIMSFAYVSCELGKV